MEHGTAVSSSPREPRSDVEWHSVLQTKSRDERLDPRHLLSQLPVEESGRAGPAVRRTRIGRPGRDIAVRVIAFSSSCFFFIRVKAGGALGNAWRRHPSRLSFFMAVGPGDQTEGCPRSECAIRHERGHPEQTNPRTLVNTSIILEVAGCLESQVERTDRAFAGFPAMEPLVQHPVEKEPSRKLSDR